MILIQYIYIYMIPTHLMFTCFHYKFVFRPELKLIIEREQLPWLLYNLEVKELFQTFALSSSAEYSITIHGNNPLRGKYRFCEDGALTQC